jgi:hypothetical protein
MADQTNLPGTWQDLETQRTGTLVILMDGVGGGIRVALRDGTGQYAVLALHRLRRMA